MNKLEELSGKKYSEILYDSKIDNGKDGIFGGKEEVFKEYGINQQYLYSIVIHSEQN